MPYNNSHGRRKFIRTAAGAGAVGLTGLSGCTGVIGGGKGTGSLTVAVYGGVFKDVMDKHLFKPFSEQVDFQVESKAAPTSEEALTQYDNAVAAGKAPVDVAIMANTGILKGLNKNLWHFWSEGDFDNLQYITDNLIKRTDKGVASIGALSWYINLVQNTNEFSEPIDTWQALWNNDYKGQMALLSYASNSYLLEVTAELHFGGKDILNSKDGIKKVLDKLKGVKPQAGMWYANEAQFQSRLRKGEIPAGMLYNDVTLVMKDKGAPVQTNFVKEGSILDSGGWVTLKTSNVKESARQFIDYASKPEVQDRIAKNLYTSPTIKRKYSNLDDATYEKIAGPGPSQAITPKYELYVEKGDWVSQQWNEFITGS